MAVSFRESGNPPSPKRDDELPLRRGLTTSNLRFAGRARNDGDGLILSFLRNKKTSKRWSRSALFVQIINFRATFAIGSEKCVIFAPKYFYN